MAEYRTYTGHLLQFGSYSEAGQEGDCSGHLKIDGDGVVMWLDP